MKPAFLKVIILINSMPKMCIYAITLPKKNFKKSLQKSPKIKSSLFKLQHEFDIYDLAIKLLITHGNCQKLKK